jgi:hypothetical protein
MKKTSGTMGAIIVLAILIGTFITSENTIAGETGKDGRFIAHDNGTVLDTKTNLIWAAKDNGNDINWANARLYCENYRGGGYTDWRMPTQNELVELHAGGAHKDMQITGWVWASDTRGSNVAAFYFENDMRSWRRPDYVYGHRALPVRSGK